MWWNRSWILTIAVLLLVACKPSGPDMQYDVVICTPIPSPRASAVSFVVGDYAYVFGGRDIEGRYLNDLWRYDIANDTWVSMGTTPLQSRVNATACVYDDIAYIGLGFNGEYGISSSYFKDWWSYDPDNGIWTQLKHYPDSATAKAICMVGEGELYVGYGFCWTYERNMYRYDVTTGCWSFIDVHLDRHALTFPIRSFGGVGTTCQGRHFAGTGFRANSLNWWGEFFSHGEWRKCKDVPGDKRTLAACTATHNFVYVIGGMHVGGVNTDGRVLSDIQQYNPQSDTWCHVANLPDGGRMNHVAFCKGNRIFVGLGENENIDVCGDLYCIYEK